MSTGRSRFGPCLAHYLDNPLEMEQRLTALEFNLNSLRWRAEGKLHRPVGHGLAHVEALPILGDPRNLAIPTGVFTAEGHDKDVEFRKSFKVCPLRSSLDRKEVYRNQRVRIG